MANNRLYIGNKTSKTKILIAKSWGCEWMLRDFNDGRWNRMQNILKDDPASFGEDGKTATSIIIFQEGSPEDLEFKEV